MQESAVKEYFETWSIYKAILDHNYMFHNEIYQDVKQFIAERYGKKPFTLLDLGCGSASHLAYALTDSSISYYLGYDLSQSALAYASQNLAPLGCSIDLRQGNLLEGLKTNKVSFDLVFSSFALHHLTKDEKAIFFQLVYNALSPQGILLLIDVVREENEDLQPYLNNYCSWMRSEWTMISPEALESVCDHIQNYDFPETLSDLDAMATQAGFQKSTKVNQFKWHNTRCFEK